MSWLNKVVSKIKGVDPFYNGIPMEHLALYQHYFNKVISQVDVESHTRWISGESCETQQLDKNADIIEHIILKRGGSRGD
jgi:hypothetical protein